MARVHLLRSRSERTDEATLAQLCDEHASALLAYSTRLTGDSRLAEDLVQETLLRAWRHPEALTGEHGSARSWLFTVAHNLAMDHFRRRSSRPREVSADAAGPDVIDFETISSWGDDSDIELAVQSLVVTEALATLSHEHRSVLAHTFYLGRSVAQTAAELGIPEGTVKSRTFYALRALKAELVSRGVTS